MGMDSRDRINNVITIEKITDAKPCLGAILLAYDEDPDETISEGGIIMPQRQPLFIVIADVIQTSDSYLSTGQPWPCPVKVGERVIVEKRSGIFMGKQRDGRYYKVIMPKDIVLILAEEEKPLKVEG